MSNPDTHFTIPTHQYGDFVTRMAKLNRKAKKLGCAPATFTVVGETVLKVEAPHDSHVEGFGSKDGKIYNIPAKIVEVAGVAPQVGDHQLLARIEYLGDKGESKLFHTVPGTETKVDERFRALSAYVCEHCNTNRIRRDTFVVRSVIDGRQLQVGRNCLADFIGGVSPAQIAASAAYLKLFDDIGGDNEGGGFLGYFSDRVDTVAALALTSAYINAYGWVPKSQAGEQFRSTASRVADHFQWDVRRTDEEKREIAKFDELAKSPVNVARATETIDWVKNELVKTARSDYELNLCTLVVGDLTERRHLGIVCSAVSAYQRAMNRGVEYAKKRIEAAKSQYVGTVGERLRNIPVTVQFVKSFASVWGSSTLVKFVDENGNMMSWFASGDKLYQAGEKLTITGTVKAHKEFKDICETQLSRVVVSPEKVS